MATYAKTVDGVLVETVLVAQDAVYNILELTEEKAIIEARLVVVNGLLAAYEALA